MNHTTHIFSRHSRQSGTEYASSIERTRRSNRDSVLIVLGCFALVCLAYGIGWWSV